jgi:catechol 2,3-dioxygenase-like lactoylglutathione lyase family enzyme
MKLGAITLFVEDVARAKEFYGRALDRSPVFEDAESVVFPLDSVVLNLLVETAAGELVAPAPVGGADAGARSQLTLTVEDADAVCAELAERGVELLNGPLDREWGLRTAAFADPDGHVWEVAQPLDG